MIAWKNMDTLAAYEELKNVQAVDLAAAMSGENGAERVKNYTVPVCEGLAFNYGARPVDEAVLAVRAVPGSSPRIRAARMVSASVQAA